MKKGLIFLLFAIALSSCSEYNKVLKSTDYELKYEYAKKYFEEKRYTKAYTLLEDVVTMFKGTDRAEEALYLLAQSYFGAGDYMTATQYFSTYYNNYPRGEYTEPSRFYSGYSYYLDSPDARLDQTGTNKAIEELQMFVEYFPRSEKVAEAEKYIAELQDKLCEKEYLNAKLYFNLGSYMGNNYESAVITAKNAIDDYPQNKFREDLMFIILESRYEEAKQSIDEKRKERFRDVVDEYYSFINDFPESKYLGKVERIFKDASSKIND